MDDNTHDIIERLMDQVNDYILSSERFNTLLNMLIAGAELDYTGKALRVGNDEVIMEFVKAIHPAIYKRKLEGLQKMKEEEKSDGK